jgi:hypothetical protein
MTDPETFPLWMGPGAELEPRVGGRVHVPFANGITASGTVLEIGRYRLAFTWGYGENTADADQVVTLALKACEAGTRLTLTHEGLGSEEERTGHAAGWRHYTATFANACLGSVLPRIEGVVDDWVRSWNVGDRDERERLLQACWTELGRFRDAGALIDDRADIARYIEGARRFMPEAHAERLGPVEHCHEYVRFPVGIRGGEGTMMMRGWHFAETDASGRLRSVVAFWDRPVG